MTNAPKAPTSLNKANLYDTTLNRSYQPTKTEMQADISVPVTPDRLAEAVVSGGAKRREDGAADK